LPNCQTLGRLGAFPVALAMGLLNTLPPGRARAEGEGEMTDRNSYKKWTSEEDELLRNLVLANVSPFDIAAELGRSVSTVKVRAHCLGITLRRLGTTPLTLPDLKAKGK
jgi:DNA-binding NarL/FixJ family response regulator